MTVSEPGGRIEGPGTEPSSEAADALPPGTKVGEYRVDHLLGEGGFGAVYRATHPLIGKTAAIKVIKAEYSGHAEMVSRFVAEARAVNAIGHRNIIDIFGFGRLPDGRHYYVMELLDGITLEAHIQKRGALSLPDALEILRPLARALDAAHRRGIAHRDLKPENIFLANVGESKPLLKLLDFGIAKLTGDLGGQHTTQAGMPMGTPAYMSPEQVSGVAVDMRADIYSFGVLAFELLSGTLPFLGESTVQMMTMHLTSPPPPLSALRPELSCLDADIAKMMAKDPSARPPSTIAAIDALTRAAVVAGLVDPLQFPPLEGAPLPLEASAPPATFTTKLPEEAGATGAARVAPRRAYAVAAALGTVVAVAVALNLPRPTVPSATVPGEVTAEASVLVLAASSPALVPTVTVVAPTVTVAPDVKVTLELDPKDAEIYVGGQRVSANPLSVVRGREPVTIELRKKGYRLEKVTIIPDRDREVHVKLMKQSQGTKEYGTWD